MSSSCWRGSFVFFVATKLVALILLALVFVPVCAAQSVAGGSISGTVVDPDHRVVPGAAVTVHNLDLSYERALTTDAGRQLCRYFIASGDLFRASVGQGI